MYMCVAENKANAYQEAWDHVASFPLRLVQLWALIWILLGVHQFGTHLELAWAMVHVSGLQLGFL
jgi:predicted short-subunit dehydrogenase-like oxidoreductase (DUF2520 family)